MTVPDLVPDPGPSLGRFYEGLPDHYVAADEAGGHELYRWLAGILGQAGDVETTLDRIDRATPDEGGAPGETSDLVDPTTAPVAWLPWIAQLVAVRLTPNLSEAEKRDAVLYASAGWRAGTKASVADAARTTLTGTQYAAVYDHAIEQPGDGGTWDVLIVTRADETPDAAAVLAAVLRRGVKPAGVVLRHRTYASSWDTVTATYPTWSALEAAGSWNQIQEGGL